MTTFSEGRERNLALGIWGAASGSGAAAGVLLGGVLTSYLDWSWIFFINIPVGIAVMALTPFLLAESRSEVGHRHFDLMASSSSSSTRRPRTRHRSRRRDRAVASYSGGRLARSAARSKSPCLL